MTNIDHQVECESPCPHASKTTIHSGASRHSFQEGALQYIFWKSWSPGGDLRFRAEQYLANIELVE